jgi:hypothetical protein
MRLVINWANNESIFLAMLQARSVAENSQPLSFGTPSERLKRGSIWCSGSSGNKSKIKR